MQKIIASFLSLFRISEERRLMLMFGEPQKGTSYSTFNQPFQIGSSVQLQNKIIESALKKEIQIKNLFPDPNRIEERGGVQFKYWKDKRDNDIIMRRSSDNGGYIQLPDEKGEIFAVVWINHDWSYEEGNEITYQADYLFPFTETVTKLNWFNRNF